MLGFAESEEVRLISGEMIFLEFQPWPRYLNVTDRRTDGRMRLTEYVVYFIPAMQAPREPQRGPENHYRGPYHSRILYAPRGRNHGEECLLPSPSDYRGLGECRMLPQWGPGEALAENGFYAYLRSERRRTPFSIFLSGGGAPKRCGARENFPPSPFSTGLHDSSLFCSSSENAKVKEFRLASFRRLIITLPYVTPFNRCKVEYYSPHYQSNSTIWVCSLHSPVVVTIE